MLDLIIFGLVIFILLVAGTMIYDNLNKPRPTSPFSKIVPKTLNTESLLKTKSFDEAIKLIESRIKKEIEKEEAKMVKKPKKSSSKKRKNAGN